MEEKTNLHQRIKEELGNKGIAQIELPEYLYTSLNRKLRPYQEECMRYFIAYMNPENGFYDGSRKTSHLLFEMATGSGKTLIMAAAMLCLYERGYRNFLFVVNSNNIIEKTKYNFLNSASDKYLFAPKVTVDGKIVEINEVADFQSTKEDCINLCLMTIQKSISALNTPKEDSPTLDGFSNEPVVILADEGHHLNVETKKGKRKSDEPTLPFGEDDNELSNWEAAIDEIFNSEYGDKPNMWLDFSATIDWKDKNIADKYKNKLIYDYKLAKFREDGYSKEVLALTADLNPMDRALQAIIVSQYKRKLFSSIHIDAKPVVLFKSKSITESKKFFGEFIEKLNSLLPLDLDRLRANAKDVVKDAFERFAMKDDESLILELQEDFREERLLLVDNKDISPEKQRLLNSLESPGNEIRAIFAVDMLNEGWDVLNLFDIVRLYDTRDARKGNPGKTTIAEAQLIGRGARYMSFTDPAKPDKPADKRKYDNDSGNPLRMAETLHYHCTNNSQYIDELHKALRDSGIEADDSITVNERLKPKFKETKLYKKGIVFANRRLTLAEAEDDGTIGKEIREKTFIATISTGNMSTSELFGNVEAETLTSLSLPIMMISLGENVVRTALGFYDTFQFGNLKRIYPRLSSIGEFINGEEYLKRINVKVVGPYSQIEKYSQRDKLCIAKEVIGQIEPLVRQRRTTYRGSHEFYGNDFRNIFRSDIQLKVSRKSTDSIDERGRSMKTPFDADLAADLEKADWYAYNDCFGTSEEKALVKYVEGIMSKLSASYEEIYLVRNENDLKIYSFDKGKTFEPDFLLFMRRKGEDVTKECLQIFIEPKNQKLALAEKWKEDFLLQLSRTAVPLLHYDDKEFKITGMPFFIAGNQQKFKEAMDELVDE